MIRKISTLLLAAALMTACCSEPCNKTLSGLNPADFETTIGDQTTQLYTLKNANGMEVCITPFGGRIVSVMVPDRTGEMRDVVLGFDKIADYQNVPSDFGASIGRYANRIGQGKFTLDGVEYDLPKNNFGHCLHGGPNGWQYKLYTVEEATATKLVLSLASPDGEEQFPGNVEAKVIYTLTDENAIAIDYEATTDAPTVINMTNHSYFNLSGNPASCAMDHVLYIASESVTPIDSTFLPTGEITSVEGTPFDFRTPKAISKDVTNFDNEQIKFGKGFDHNWVLSTNGDVKKVAAKLTSPESGITLEVYTDEPGVQLYTGNFLDGTVTGKKGIVYNQRASVCLETQHYPDSPNKAHWPSVVLKPGETYRSHCIFKFGVEK